ncbi:MAG: cyclase [Acidobacteria bacterium]|nr:cyclase [Acidobacteriota bacterium]
MLIDLSLRLAENNLFTRGSPVAHLGHLGTHLDTAPGEVFPLERCIGPACLIDVSSVRGRTIEPADMDEARIVEPGDFVVLRTGWLAEAYPSDRYLREHPELSESSLSLLVSRRAGVIGVDAPGLGRPERHGEVDRHLARHGIFVVENLANLEAVGRRRFRIYCFPLALEGTSGLPARVVAELA